MLRYLTIILLLFSINLTKGVSANKELTYLGLDQGLSNNNVTKIFQDKEGFIWIGTYDGLNRYDGYSFSIFKNHPNKIASLPDNRVTDIAQDKNETLWVATKTGFAALKKNGSTFKRVTLRHNDQHTKQIQYSINKILIGDNKVFAASEEDGLLIVSEADHNNLSASTIPLISEGIEVVKYNAQGVIMDVNGKIWTFIHQYGLCFFDEKNQCIRIKKSDISVSSFNISTSPDGDIWISSSDGVYRYNTRTDQLRTYQNPLFNNALGLAYHNNEMWVYTDGSGIIKIHCKNHTYEQLFDNNKKLNLNSQSITSIYRDSNSRIWIGTLRGGVNVINEKKRFQTLINRSNNSTLQQNYILSFSEGKNNIIWIGTDGDGLIKYDTLTKQFTQYPLGDINEKGKLNNGFITSIIEEDNKLWLSTYGGGVACMDLTHQTFKTYHCVNPNNNYNSLNVWKLYRDSKKRIWASTLNAGGIYIYNELSDSFQLINAEIYDALAFHEESPDILWFGSWKTLTRFNKKSGDVQNFTIGKPVRSIHPDGKKLWLATEGGGLIHFNKATGTFEQFTETDGLPSNTLLNIIEDEESNLWISSYNGLIKFSPEESSIRSYNSSDGLQSNQFSYNAALKLSSNKLIFGGIAGFNIFDPKNIVKDDTEPKITITHFYINKTPWDQYYTKTESSISSLFTIPYNDASISLSFSNLEYSYPNKIQYSYYLEGWDDDWNYADKQRTAHYSGLKEGNYTLRIKSTNSDGVWSKSEKTIQIKILPPWYRIFWIKILYMLLLLTVVVLFWKRYKDRQVFLSDQTKLTNWKSLQHKESIYSEKKLAQHITHDFGKSLVFTIPTIKEVVQKKRKNHFLEHPQIYTPAKKLLHVVDTPLTIKKTDNKNKIINTISEIVSDKKVMLIVDSDVESKTYLQKMFNQFFDIKSVKNIEDAMIFIKKIEPDIILSDIFIEGLLGINFCSTIKSNPTINHIPIILLAADSSPETKLKGLESGADDYLIKPFNEEILSLKVNNIIQSKSRLQNYFYNEITLQKNDQKIPLEYKDFIEKAIKIVEKQLDNSDFNVKMLADCMGMSHSNMYRRFKAVSGKSANEFIRFVRLRHVAKQLIYTNSNINQAAFSAGFNDIKYFRSQFIKLFGMNPSEYKKRYQKLSKKHHMKM